MSIQNEAETIITQQYLKMGIQKEVYDFGHSIEAGLKERFEQIDKMAEYNQLKVIHAMQKNKVSAECFNQSSGYGYNDLGRDTLEKVYADVFCAEDALVRPQITCGTHALALALMSNLRPGDELLSPVGKPYDTLEEVIGIRPSKGSLAEYGISYRQVDLLEDGSFDFENIKKAINDKTKLVTIQRSKGYQTRPTLSVDRIGELIAFVKAKVAAGGLDSDDQIRSAIEEGEDKFGVTLTEDEINQIIAIMQKINQLGLDPNVLVAQAEDLYSKFGKDFLKNLDTDAIAKEVAKSAASGFFAKIGDAIKGFFAGLFQ